MTKFRDTVSLVTGASRGIGPVIAARLAARGSRVVCVARDRSGLERTCSEIEKAGGVAVPVAADLSNIAELGTLLEEAEKAAGPIDILVNNAGVEYYRRYQEYTAQELAAVLNVNLHAPLELTRQVLPKMLQRGRGNVVSIASLAGKKGVSYNAPYSATKAGILLWSEAVRQELRDTPVRISAVIPGYIRDAGMFADDGVAAPRMLGTSTPEDVADAVVRAVEEDLPEVIVSPGPMRPMLALGQLSPTLSDRIVEWMGVNRLNDARRRQRS